MALSALHVVAEDTDTFAENVVVDLIRGARNGGRYGYGGRSVGGVGYVGVLSAVGTVSEVGVGFGP